MEKRIRGFQKQTSQNIFSWLASFEPFYSFHVWQTRVLILLLVTVVYFFAGKFGLSLAFVNQSATAVWPPTGIAIAAFLIFGKRIWISIFIGAFLVNVTTAGTIATSLAIGFGNMMEGFIAAMLVSRFANGIRAFDQIKDVFKFTLLAGIVSTMVSATIGVTSLALAGFASWSAYGQIWVTWWLGDAGGALIAAPFLILWAVALRTHKRIERLPEFALLIVLLLFVGFIVFRGIPGYPFKNYTLAYITFPLLLWSAFRFGRQETVTAAVILSSIAVWSTLHGFGPFIASTPNESLLLLQIFMATATIMAIAVATTVFERRQREAYFRALIERSFDAISLVNAAGVILYASPSTRQILGYNPEELIGLNEFALVHEDERKNFVEALGNLARHPHKIAVIEARVRDKNGSWIWTEATLTNLLDEPGVRAIVVNYRDITVRKEAEKNFHAYYERLVQEKVKADALLESIGDGIVATDQQGKIILVNKAFENSLGLQEKDILGRRTAEVLPMETILDGAGALIPEQERPLNLTMISGKKSRHRGISCVLIKQSFPRS